MHLVDHARAYIEDHKGRPLPERMFRAALVKILSNRSLFRASLFLAALAKPFQFILPKQLKAMVGDAPAPKTPGPAAHPNVFPAQGQKRGRMALLSGCVQPVVSPGIDEAVVRLMTRHGVEIVVAAGQGCCGALAHHMGDHVGAQEKAKINIAAWEAEIAKGGLDAIVISASGCGTVIKDYGFIFRDDPQWAARAARISALCKDVTEVLATLDLMPPVIPAGQKVAYHSACSLQHGQKITNQPRELLARAGFDVQEIGEGHICCGSAGTYSMLQPELSGQLRARKLSNIAATEAPICGGGQCRLHHASVAQEWRSRRAHDPYRGIAGLGHGWAEARRVSERKPIMEPIITLDEAPDPALRQKILRPLLDFNTGKIGDRPLDVFALFIRDADKEIIGGLWARDFYDWVLH